VKVGDKEVTGYVIAKVRDAAMAAEPDEAKKAKAGAKAVADAAAAFDKELVGALGAAGYPKAGDANIVKMADVFDIGRPQVAALIGLLLILVVFVTMVYGPIAAALVELFPTRIRYTSMSLPYHIGNGWFGGLLPATALAMVSQTGDIYYGLWYPIVFAVMTFVIGLIFIPETKDRDIYAHD
jgi:Sugar (and other) transporter